MKILHVYRTYFPDTQGGLEEAIRQLCFGLRDLGIENRIFTLSPAPNPAVIALREATVHRFHRSFEIASCSVSLGCLQGFKELAQWADIIHYQFPWPFADLLHLATRPKKPTVLSYQSDIVRQKFFGRLYRPLMHRFLDSVDTIVASSPNYCASSPVLSAYSQKTQVIPIGIDPAVYTPASEGALEGARRKYGQDFFLFVGVLRYYKGLPYLLEAARGAPFQVVIAGKGPMEEQLQQQARSMGLSNVHFCGYIDDAEKIALMSLARAIVFPSHLRSEAFGVTLVEGAMFAKPLISAEIGTGTSFINQHGQSGIVIPPCDPAALREAMLRLHNDAGLAQQLGEGAGQRFTTHFTASRMAASYLEVYRKLLAR